MAGEVVRTPDSEVPDLDGLWERVRDAVAARSGADKSLWNGTLHYSDPAQKVRGSASSDGTLRLSRDLVVEPLQEMYATRGQPATNEQWIARRNALKTVAHEYTHLTAPDHHDYADRLSDMRQPQFKPLEEGVTEAWSQAALDDLADRVLPPDLAAEIKAVRGVRSYPGWEPAARSFADEVGAEVGEDGDEVLRRMANAPRTEKARVAADLLFENSDLPDLVPAEEREAVRQEIAAEIDKGFADLQPLNQDTSVNRRSVSRQRGMEIADSAVDVVGAAEDRYRNSPEQEQQQQLQTTQEATRPQQDLSALPPPDPADRIPNRPEPPQQPTPAVDPRVAFAQESPAQQQARLRQAEGAQGNRPADPRGTSAQGRQPSPRPDGRGGGGSPAADQDVTALRAVLDQQAPAAGAPRVPQGQATQGRRGGAHTGTEQSAGRSTETPSR